MGSLTDFLDVYQIDDEVVAVGVSGGADSLALVLWLQQKLQPKGKSVVALTVDHKLREESGDEAQYVAEVMKKYGIEHHILEWNGDKPITGVEEAAREARYKLIQQWCVEHGVKTLFIAHHALDQAETFFLRLQRGSGLVGLSGMQPISYRNGLKIVRPFLHINPQDLKQFLQTQSVEWVEDPSNQCDDYLRVRIRKFMPQVLETLDMSLERMIGMMDGMARTRNYLQSLVDEYIKKNVCFWDDCGVSLSMRILGKQHEELIYLLLSTLLKKVGGGIYSPRSEDVERLAKRLFGDTYKGIDYWNIQLKDTSGNKRIEDNFNGATLAGCEVFECRGKLCIVKELKSKQKMPKKVWDEFCLKYPQYERLNLPYKLRVALVKTKMKVEF